MKLLLQAADFLLGLAAILFLAVFLAGCGAEPEPEVVARHEVCTVKINPDGTIACVCKEVEP